MKALVMSMVAAGALCGGTSVLAQALPPPVAVTHRDLWRPAPDRDDATRAATQTRAGRERVPRLPGTAPAVRVRLSGHLGYTTFTASDTFEAVLDKSGGPVYGGGVGVLLGRRLFVDVQVSRFSADGERVFVTDDLQVFPLGIPTTVTTTPIDVSVGWRFAPGAPRPGLAPARQGFRPVPFVGGGVGLLQYDETADFAESGDDVSDSFGSYHVLGGVELPFTSRIGASVDGLYRWVPDAIGEGGASAVFGDTDLGGLTIRVRATFTF